MNVNFLCRNLCRFNGNSLKSHIFKTTIKYGKLTRVCQCSISSCTNKLTSNRFFVLVQHSPPPPPEWISNRTQAYCTESGRPPPTNKLPPLMNFPRIVWPSLMKSFKNFILATFIIKPYLDREFNLPDFVAGSKKAVEVVSNKLSEGDLKSLDGLVTSDIIPNLQQNVSLMSMTQREQIAINAEDIYFSFPYQVGIIFNDDDTEHQTRFVEITMVYHTLKGLATMRGRGEEPPINMGMMPEYQSKISICNYRFIREFTKGVESDWTVNLLNHFRPVDEKN